MEPSQNLDFESSVKELEKLVAELEKGSSPIDQQMKSFERGVALSRDCLKHLETLEKKVEVIGEDANGKMGCKPFEPGQES